MKRGTLYLAVLLVCAAEPVSGQRLLEEWRVRTTAGAEAVVTGATAVFWNPAQVVVSGRGEVVLLDLRGPGITGVNGLAAAGAARLDERTTLALGYEHVGVDGIEQTTTSPDGGHPLSVAEDRFAIAASHQLGSRSRLGALVQYTLLPDVTGEKSVIALGAGLQHQPLADVPLVLAGMAATEGEDMYWMAGAEVASGERWREWHASAEYGATGGQLAPGVTHRVAAAAEWRRLAQVTVGLVVEPDGGGRSVEPIAGASIRMGRYHLGIVREQLPNEFGGAYSFQFGVAF